MAKLVTLIKTKSPIGQGTENDPCRILTEYWDLNENLLFAVDPFELPAKPTPSTLSLDVAKIAAIFRRYRDSDLSSAAAMSEIGDILYERNLT